MVGRKYTVCPLGQRRITCLMSTNQGGGAVGHMPICPVPGRAPESREGRGRVGVGRRVQEACQFQNRKAIFQHPERGGFRACPTSRRNLKIRIWKSGIMVWEWY